MRKILIIGIGAGDPDYLTMQAVKALNAADVFFIPDKGAEKAALRQRRMAICERFVTGTSHRFVDVKLPARNADFADYRSNVAEWHTKIEESYVELLTQELGEGECGAFLVWGDPTLYDSTLRIIDSIRSKARFALDFDVIPGISAVQALAAKHRIALNEIGGAVHITTGRKLTEGFPDNADSVVVLLDGEQAFKRLDGADLDIYWGAYVGAPEEILLAGKLSDMTGDIETIRDAARRKNGWIMDTYILRKAGK
jgi:precorrin-6A synthase